jgi:putative spermidine/putrescine transport system ATP-binding protein
VMSDRVAIFSAGRIEQLGTGEDLYDRPASLFVADFIGESNILRGRYERDATGGWLVRETRRWRVGEPAAERAALENGSPAALIVRPERMRMATRTDAPPSNANVVDATVDVVLYLGSDRKYELALPDGLRAAVRRQRDGADREWQRGDQVALEWAIDDGVLVADPTA